MAVLSEGSLGQNPTEQELQDWIGGDGEHEPLGLPLLRSLTSTIRAKHHQMSGVYLLSAGLYIVYYVDKETNKPTE